MDEKGKGYLFKLLLYDKDSDECPVWELPISSIYSFNHFTERSLRA